VLSDWKAPDAIDALAAACAGCGEFNEAVKWEQKAIDLTPGKHKTEFLTRVQLYRAGRPYHDPK
jgi:serine/threonine-protein kinase